MSDIQRNLGLPKLSQLATHDTLSADLRLLKQESRTAFADESVGWTNLLCLFLSGPVIAAQ
jgi:hypothetical protein